VAYLAQPLGYYALSGGIPALRAKSNLMHAVSRQAAKLCEEPAWGAKKGDLAANERNKLE